MTTQPKAPEPSAQDEMRVAFESFVRAVPNTVEPTRDFTRRNDDGTYFYQWTESNWSAWQARALLASQPAAPVPSLRHSETYVADLEDSLKQIADLLGVTGGADALLAKVKSMTAAPVMAASDREKVLLDVIRVIRHYPVFDDPTHPYAKMIDGALAGKSPVLLATIDSLSRGEIPTAEEMAAARAERIVPASPVECQKPEDCKRKDGSCAFECQNLVAPVEAAMKKD